MDQLHALAPPFAGRWYTKPIDPAIALELMARQFEARLEEDSLFYLEAAMWKSAGGPKGVLGEELVQKNYAFARRYKAEVKPERAAAHFKRALCRDVSRLWDDARQPRETYPSKSSA